MSLFYTTFSFLTAVYCSVQGGSYVIGDEELTRSADKIHELLANPDFQMRHVKCAVINMTSRVENITQFERILSGILSKEAKVAETEVLDALLNPTISHLFEESPLALRKLKDIPNFLNSFLTYEGDFCGSEWRKIDEFILTMAIDGVSALKYLALKIPHQGIHAYINDLSEDDVKSKLEEWGIIHNSNNTFTRSAWKIISFEAIPNIINKLTPVLMDELLRQSNMDLQTIASLELDDNSLVNFAIAYRTLDDSIKEDIGSYLGCVKRISHINFNDCLEEKSSRKLDNLLPPDTARFYKKFWFQNSTLYSNFYYLLKNYKKLSPKEHVDALFTSIVSQEFPLCTHLPEIQRSRQQDIDSHKDSCLKEKEGECEAFLRGFVKNDLMKQWKRKTITEIVKKVDPKVRTSGGYLFSFLKDFDELLDENSIFQILENSKNHPIILPKLLELYKSFPSLDFLNAKGSFCYSVKKALADNCPLSEPAEGEVARRMIPFLSYYDLEKIMSTASNQMDIYANLTALPREARIRYTFEAYQDELEHFYLALQPPYEHLKAIVNSGGVCDGGQALSACLEQLKMECQNIKPRTRYPLDYSQLIRKLSPHIKWDGEHVRDEDVYVRSGKLFAVADYFNLEKEGHPDPDGFFIPIWQYVPLPNEGIVSHTFVLEGGPGGSESPLAKNHCLGSWKRTGKNNAFYRIDHRGCGENGFKHLENWRTTLISFTNFEEPHNGLPPRFLTIYNAGMDLGMLAEAIRTQYGHDQIVILNGFSYGSSWGYVSLLLFPRMFTAAVLGGVPFRSPFLKVQSTPDLEPLISLCSEAPACAEVFQAAATAQGSGEPLHSFIVREIDSGMKELLHPTNQCGRYFNNVLMFQFPKRKIDDSIPELQSKLKDIEVLFNGLIGPDGNLSQFHGASFLLLLLIAGSAACPDFELFKKILDSVLGGTMLRDADIFIPHNGARMNYFVNWVVNISMTHKEQLQALQHSALLPFLSHLNLVAAYGLFEDKISTPFRELTQHGIPSFESDVTKVIVGESKLDLNTPPGPGKKLFDVIKAKNKYLLPFKYHSHDGYINSCMRLVRDRLMDGEEIGQDEIDRSVQEVNSDVNFLYRFDALPGVLKESPKLLKRKRKGGD